jgi:hypothetical protein
LRLLRFVAETIQFVSRLAAVMLDRAPRVRSAPEVLLHRDARRIEPDWLEPTFQGRPVSARYACLTGRPFKAFRLFGPAKP